MLTKMTTARLHAVQTAELVRAPARPAFLTRRAPASQVRARSLRPRERPCTANGVGRPARMSPRLESIWMAARNHAQNGTVPPSRARTTMSRDVESLIGGPAIFTKIADLLADTRDRAWFQTYELHLESEATQLLLDGIARLHARKATIGREEGPATVWIMVNRFTLVPGNVVAGLRERIRALALDPARVRVEVGEHNPKFLDSLHSKSLVVDGEHAVITGANLQDRNDAHRAWYDLGFVVHGPIALGLEDDARFAWERSAPMAVLELGRGRSSERERAAGPVPAIIASRIPGGRLGAHKLDTPQDAAFLAAIRGARSRLRIQTPNVNEPEHKKALVEAVERGCRVELVLSKGFNGRVENIPLQGGGNVGNVEDLMRRLARRGADALSRFDARWYCHEAGQPPIEGGGPHASHAKYTSIDGVLVATGSRNWDIQSSRSGEVNILFESRTLTEQLDREVFEPCFQRSEPALPELKARLLARREKQERIQAARKARKHLVLPALSCP